MLPDLREGWTEFRARAWVWAIVAIFSFPADLAFAPYFALGATVAEDVYGTARVLRRAGDRARGGDDRRRGDRLPLAPAAPDAPRHEARLPWPAAIAVFASGATRPAGRAVRARRLRPVAVRRLVADRARRSGSRRTRSPACRAYDWMGSLALLPLGYLLAGPLGEAIGPPRCSPSAAGWRSRGRWRSPSPRA